MTEAEEAIAQLNKPHEYRRIAVRDGEGQPWRWFSRPIAFSLLALTSTAPSRTAWYVLESEAAEAIVRYPTQHIKLVIAPTLEALDLMDMDLSGDQP